MKCPACEGEGYCGEGEDEREWLVEIIKCKYCQGTGLVKEENKK
jgi:hypothetical protein